MTQGIGIRLVAAVLAAGALSATAGLAHAWPGSAERQQAACAQIRQDTLAAIADAERANRLETALLEQAGKYAASAESVRGVDIFSLRANLVRAQEALRAEQAAREDERGLAFSQHDINIVRLKALVNSLKDRQLSLEDSQNTGGLIASSKNALDREAAASRAGAARQRQAAIAANARVDQLNTAYGDCMAELQRIRTRRSDARDEPPDEAYANAGGYEEPVDYPVDPGVRRARLRNWDDGGDRSTDRDYRDRPDREDWSDGRRGRNREDVADRRGNRRDRGERGDRNDRRDRDDGDDRGERSGHDKRRGHGGGCGHKTSQCTPQGCG